MGCNCRKKRVDARLANNGVSYEVTTESGETRTFLTYEAATTYSEKYNGTIRAISQPV